MLSLVTPENITTVLWWTALAYASVPLLGFFGMLVVRKKYRMIEDIRRV